MHLTPTMPKKTIFIELEIGVWVSEVLRVLFAELALNSMKPSRSSEA